MQILVVAVLKSCCALGYQVDQPSGLCGGSGELNMSILGSPGQYALALGLAVTIM